MLRFKDSRIFLVVTFFAITSLFLLVITFASREPAYFETETSQANGPLSVEQNQLASNGEFIQFNNPPVTGDLDLEFDRPAGWETWPRVQLTTGTNNINLDQSTVLVMPDSPVLKTTTITGNNANVSIVVIGGNIQINSRTDDQAARYAIRLRGNFNHAYFEGLLFDGIGQSDGINSGAIIDTLTLQNVFFDRHYGGNGRNYRTYPIVGEDGLGDWYTWPDHNDTLQSWPNDSGKIKRVYLYNVVSGALEPYGRGGTHGKFSQGVAPTVDGIYKNVDVVLHVAPEARKAGCGECAVTHHGGTDTLWSLSSNLSKVRCEGVYVLPNSQHSRPWVRTASSNGCQGGIIEGLRPGGPIIKKEQVGLDYADFLR